MAAENTTVEEKRQRRRKSRSEAVNTTEAVAAVGSGKGQATPGRRQREEEESEGRVSFPRRFINYFHDVRSELTKVVWPTREEVIRLTRIVIITTLACAIFLGAISLVFNFFVQQGLNAPVLFVIAFALITAGAIYYIRRGDTPKRSY